MMEKTWVKVLLYPILATIFFALFLWVSLPVEKIEGIVKGQMEAALGHQYNVTFTTFDLSGISGFVATDIEISKKPPPPSLSKEEKEAWGRVSMTLDKMEIKVALLKAIVGTIEAEYDIQISSGTIQGIYEQVDYEPVEVKPSRAEAARARRAATAKKRRDAAVKKNAKGDDGEDKDGEDEKKEEDEEEGKKTARGHHIKLNLGEVPMKSLTPLRHMTGLPINGTIDGDVDVLVGARGELLEGTLDVTLARTSAGPGELPFETGLGKFQVKNPIRLGDITAKAHVEAGKLVIDGLESTGPDIVLEANGNITLQQPMTLSRARLNARVKPDPNFLKVNSLDAVLGLNPKIRNAKAGDWYGILLTGPLRDLKPFPSSRTASGLDKIKPN